MKQGGELAQQQHVNNADLNYDEQAAARTFHSGVIINSPPTPTPSLVQALVKMFEIDVIIILEENVLSQGLTHHYAKLR